MQNASQLLKPTVCRSIFSKLQLKASNIAWQISRPERSGEDLFDGYINYSGALFLSRYKNNFFTWLIGQLHPVKAEIPVKFFSAYELIKSYENKVLRKIHDDHRLVAGVKKIDKKRQNPCGA